MRGQILVFNQQKEVGPIITEDGRSFPFHINDRDDVVPRDRGMNSTDIRDNPMTHCVTTDADKFTSPATHLDAPGR